MPRQQINYPDLTFKEAQIELRKAQPPTKDEPHSEFGPWNESALHVGWQGVETAAGESTRHGLGWVQVGMEVDVEYARFAIAGRNGAKDDRTLMWTPTLSPGEVDRLIGLLKRAKRKAFRSQ